MYNLDLLHYLIYFLIGALCEVSMGIELQSIYGILDAILIFSGFYIIYEHSLFKDWNQLV